MQSKHLAASVLAVSTLVIACSSGTTSTTGDGGSSGSSGGASSGSSGGSGTSGGATAKARVTFDSTISPGTHTAAQCGQTGTWFTIGSFGNPASGRVDPSDPASPLKDPIRPVDDGADEQGGKVAVTCSVKVNGAKFDVAAHAELTGSVGGAVTVTGSFGTSGDQTGITMSLTKKGETFTANDCVATFDVSAGQAIAAGRVWTEITCPNAVQPSADRTCKAVAQLRFENCAQ